MRLQEKFKAGLLCPARFFTNNTVSKKFCEQFLRRHSMNNLRQFCAAFILTLAVAASTFAGQIECPGVAGSPSASEATVAGDIPNGVESTDAGTELVTSLLNLLSFV
jgi:hypothetical protein